MKRITNASSRHIRSENSASTGRKLCTVAAFTLTSIVLSACNTAQQESAVAHPRNEAISPELAQADANVSEFAIAALPAKQISRKIAMESSAIVPGGPLTLLQDTAHSIPQGLPSNEKYESFVNNKTISTLDQPVSTFSIDVDTGAYANVRRFLQNGQLPPNDAVRVEEMLNYFNYDYPHDATQQQPFSVVTEVGPTPWNTNTSLLHIGLQGYVPEDIAERSANLVFLIDVSGSMASHEKLGLLKSAMSLMTQQLDEKDTVSIVVYAGSSGVVLEPTPGNATRTIESALARLQAGGSTNGAQGIELAYEIAMDNYIENGTNRVILATDGDFNVGTSDTKSLIKMIENKRKSGVALTTLGFGMGNYNDHLMEQLADAGNGNYAYLDTLGEARKVLVDELTSTLVTIAKDVKIQIEFNPATIAEYRLIGYTNRILDNEDFNDDRIDAGEIGAGHSVTALYEVALKGSGGERQAPRRYDTSKNDTDTLYSTEIAELRLRYKLPDSNKSQLISTIIERDSAIDSLDATSDAYRFAASVAGFGQLLRGDTRIEDFNFEAALDLARDSTQDDPFGYRAEYFRLVDLAQSLDNLQRAAVNASEESNG